MPMLPRIAIPVPHSERDYAERALKPYEDSVRQAGGEPVRVELELPNPEIARLASRCDAILLPGSKADIAPQKYGATPDPRTAQPDPARDNADELLLQDAFNMRKPVLGICYGLQALNVWRTGTLLQHIESEVNHQAGREVSRAHTVTLEPGSLLSEIIGPACHPALWVNSSHHQAAEIAGDGLRVVARAEKDRLIEALEGTAPDHFVLAVQWHPERTFEQDEPSRAIFRALIDAARRRHQQPRVPAPDFESSAR